MMTVPTIATHAHVEIIHGLEAYSQARQFDVIHDHDGLASRAMGALELLFQVVLKPVIVEKRVVDVE